MRYNVQVFMGNKMRKKKKKDMEFNGKALSIDIVVEVKDQMLKSMDDHFNSTPLQYHQKHVKDGKRPQQLHLLTPCLLYVCVCHLL